jgi:formylglycine-generating enzyme required for sulfatase activity
MISSDVYSLGATYFALMTGPAPFDEAADEAALAQAHANEPIPNVREGIAEIPLRCDAIVRRAMAKQPRDRYATVAAMLADLEAVTQSDRPEDPRKKVDLARVLAGQRKPWRERIRAWLPGSSLLVLAGACAGVYFALPYLKSKARTTEKTENAAPVQLPTFTNSIGERFLRVPAGVYTMGDPLLADARPRLVRVTLPFFMGATEVTQREFKLVMNSNPSKFVDDENPVDSVTWAEAREFCERLSQHPAEKHSGRLYRLPTEAEWEYCCRAGTRTHFAFGNSLRFSQANIRTGGLLRPTPASTYPLNPWGFADVHGNLWEWCSDWYKSDYFAESPVEDPQGPPNGHRRVLRGGSWNVGPEDCLSARRHDRILPDERSPEVGFRIVCIVSDVEAVEK